MFNNISNAFNRSSDNEPIDTFDVEDVKATVENDKDGAILKIAATSLPRTRNALTKQISDEIRGIHDKARIEDYNDYIAEDTNMSYEYIRAGSFLSHRHVLRFITSNCLSDIKLDDRDRDVIGLTKNEFNKLKKIESYRIGKQYISDTIFRFHTIKDNNTGAHLSITNSDGMSMPIEYIGNLFTLVSSNMNTIDKSKINVLAYPNSMEALIAEMFEFPITINKGVDTEPYRNDILRSNNIAYNEFNKEGVFIVTQKNLLMMIENSFSKTLEELDNHTYIDADGINIIAMVSDTIKKSIVKKNNTLIYRNEINGKEITIEIINGKYHANSEIINDVKDRLYKDLVRNNMLEDGDDLPDTYIDIKFISKDQLLTSDVSLATAYKIHYGTNRAKAPISAMCKDITFKDNTLPELVVFGSVSKKYFTVISGEVVPVKVVYDVDTKAVLEYTDVFGDSKRKVIDASEFREHYIFDNYAEASQSLLSNTNEEKQKYRLANMQHYEALVKMANVIMRLDKEMELMELSHEQSMELGKLRIEAEAIKREVDRNKADRDSVSKSMSIGKSILSLVGV